MRLTPRSLFGRNLLLLVGMILLGQLLAGVLFFVFVQKPRAAETADMLAQNLIAVREGLAALPAAERVAFVARLNAANTGEGEPEAIHDNRLLPAQRILVRAISAQLARHGIDAIWRRERGALSVRLTVDGEDHWLTVQGPNLSARPGLSTLMSWAATLAIALFGAWRIQRRINRPLDTLASAAGAIEAGRTPDPVCEQGPEELAAVARGFNRMQAALAERERSRALMLAGISHDLRTPLSKMRLSVELLRDAHDTPPDPVLLDSMAGACQRMDEIIGQFIDFARLDDTTPPEPLNLLDCLHQARGACPEGETVAIDAPADLGVLSHHPALTRLLTNLISNALKHGAPPVQVRARAERGEVLIVVDDAGPGIAADRIDTLRQPFTQGDSARGGVPGAGLGLAIADQIARTLGIALRFDAAPLGGLRVELRLPAPNS
ncbi:ATP-binding protein [Nitrogeniibacter aestuarii]|uniref:ATP-binding protein n=1 Tax=Nitrogeniibacter aestuarii TaxID=2815343 RepID=UPI001E398276|nr:ATP-binding protein [Nitrogeniibacter aestuarii]